MTEQKTHRQEGQLSEGEEWNRRKGRGEANQKKCRELTTERERERETLVKPNS